MITEKAKKGLRYIRISKNKTKSGRIYKYGKYLPAGQYYYYSAKLQSSSKAKAQEALDYCANSIVPMMELNK